MPRRKETYLDLAVSALEAEGRPMGCTEIIAWAWRKGRLDTKASTPENTLHAALSRSISNDPHTPFMKRGRGRFGLKMGTGVERK
jgi:hypothetical protein